jgi:hypothetical protein
MQGFCSKHDVVGITRGIAASPLAPRGGLRNASPDGAAIGRALAGALRRGAAANGSRITKPPATSCPQHAICLVEGVRIAIPGYLAHGLTGLAAAAVE